MELKYKSWDDITIAKYYELEEISNDSSSEGEDKNMEIIACLCDLTPVDIARLPFLEYQSLKGDLKFLGQFSFDTKHDLKEIVIGERKYKVCRDFSKFSTAQYLDFQSLYTKNDLKQYYGQILATFLLPTTVLFPEGYKEYNTGYDVVEEAKYIYNNLSITTANQLMYFFVKRWASLTRITLIYLKGLAHLKLKKKDLPEIEREMWMKIKEVTDTPGLVASMPFQIPRS